MLLADNKRLQQRLKALQETVNAVTDKNVELLSQKETFGWSSTCKLSTTISKETNLIKKKQN